MNPGVAGLHYAITGGASGFGFAIAQQLVTEGATVTLLGRRGDALDTAREEIGRDRVHTVVCDISNAADVRAAFAQLKTLDGLVNNAGVARPGAIEANHAL